MKSEKAHGCWVLWNFEKNLFERKGHFLLFWECPFCEFTADLLQMKRKERENGLKYEKKADKPAEDQEVCHGTEDRAPYGN